MKVATFYMKGNHIITVDGVKEVTMTRDHKMGSYAGYTIEWEDGYKPSLFSLSIPEIVAVKVTEASKPYSFLGWFKG